MISDAEEGRQVSDETIGLNAPSGTGCFLTNKEQRHVLQERDVLMHLLVLGAF